MPILNIQMAGQAQAPDGSPIPLHPALALLQRGPCVQVTVTVAGTVAEELLQQGQAIPTPQSGFALIDTGASGTCVDRTAAQQMGLPVVDVAHMSSASAAATECNVHPVNIEFVVMPIKVDVPRALGVELAAQGFLALIGRDVLSQCTLHYNGTTGQFTLAL